MPHARKIVRTVNWPAVAAFAVVGVLVGGTLYFAHARQAERLANSLLQRAESLAQEEKWPQAASYFQRYLALRPADAAAHVRLAETYDQAAFSAKQKSRAVDLYYRAVGVAPARTDLRQRLASLLLELDRYVQAQEQAEELLRVTADDQTGLRIRALALRDQALEERQATIEDARQALETAQRRYPGDLVVAEALVEVYRRHSPLGDTEKYARQADLVMDELVLASSDPGRAYLARSQYRTRYGLAGAQEDLQQAAALAPEQPAVLLALGNDALERGAAQEAVEFFQDVIRRAPQPLAFLGLGDSQAASGDAQAAVASWIDGLKLAPDDVALNLRLADALLRQGLPEDAASYLNTANRRLNQHGPESANTPASLRAQVALLRARCLRDQGQTLEAMAVVKQITLTLAANIDAQQDQTLSNAWALLGEMHAGRQEWEDAALAYSQAAKLTPEVLGHHVAAMMAVAASGDVAAAITRCREILDRNDAPGHVWLTLAHFQLHQQRALPRSQRRLEPIRETLLQAEKALPSAWEIALVKAELLALQETPEAADTAVKLLQEAEGDHPQATSFWSLLTLAYERLGASAEADRALEHLATLEQDPLTLSLIRADLLMLRNQTDAARKALLQANAYASEQARPRVWRALAALERRASDLAEVRHYLKQAAEAQPQDLALAQELAELALALRNWAEAERWEARLRDLEGPDGAVWRLLKAQRLVAEAPNVADVKFQQAIHLQREITARRPHWPPGLALRAVLEQRQGRIEAAISAYQAALAGGLRQAFVYEQLLVLLCQSQKYDDAVALCLGMPETTQVERGVLLADLLRTGKINAQWEAPIEAALATTVEQQPSHAPTLFALANLRLVQGKGEEAIALLERVIELEPSNYPAWNNLAMALAEREDRCDRALECVERALELAGGAVPALVDTKALVLLRLGKPREAAALLEELVRGPGADDPRFHFHQALAYDQSGDLSAAAQALEAARQHGFLEQGLTAAENEQLADLRERLGQ